MELPSLFLVRTLSSVSRFHHHLLLVKIPRDSIITDRDPGERSISPVLAGQWQRLILINLNKTKLCLSPVNLPSRVKRCLTRPRDTWHVTRDTWQSLAALQFTILYWLRFLADRQLNGQTWPDLTWVDQTKFVCKFSNYCPAPAGQAGTGWAPPS